MYRLLAIPFVLLLRGFISLTKLRKKVDSIHLVTMSDICSVLLCYFGCGGNKRYFISKGQFLKGQPVQTSHTYTVVT